MINKKYLKILRSKKKIEKNNFIYELTAKRIIDSLDLVTVPFSEILEIGINDNKIFNYLKNKYPNSKITRSDLYTENQIIEYDYLRINTDLSSLVKNYYNLIYSNIFIHYLTNIEQTLQNIFQSLKPNSFFIATVPDSENIYQLVNSLYETDKHFYNGIYRRINPTIKINDIISMLRKVNFSIPMINKDGINIKYQNFEDLIFDIRSTHSTYCYDDKKKEFENKNYLKKLEENYKKKYYTKSFTLDLKFNIVTSWKQ